MCPLSLSLQVSRYWRTVYVSSVQVYSVDSFHVCTYNKVPFKIYNLYALSGYWPMFLSVNCKKKLLWHLLQQPTRLEIFQSLTARTFHHGRLTCWFCSSKRENFTRLSRRLTYSVLNLNRYYNLFFFCV